MPPPDVSAIGLGCATFGREIDEDASFALLDYAWERGVRHFDTAVAYGNGTSERILGRWLALRRPADPVVATKGLPPYSPENLRASLEGSLERLGRDRVDTYYLHKWDPSLTPEGLAVLHEAQRAGQTRALGISNIRSGDLAAVLDRQMALGLAPFGVLQCNQNFAVTEVDESVRALQARYGFRIVTFSPLGAGFLTGKHRDGVVPGSRFDRVPGHQAIYFQDTARARLDRLHAVAARTGHAPVQLALAWALRRPGVATVLVGGRTTAHLDQAFAARDFADHEALAALEATTTP